MICLHHQILKCKRCLSPSVAFSKELALTLKTIRPKENEQKKTDKMPSIPIIAHLSTPVWYMAAADSTDKLDTSSMNKITRTVIRMIWNMLNITGIPSFEENGLKIFPNPSNTFVTIQGLKPDFKGTYRIINLAGIEMKQGNIGPSDAEVIQTSLPPKGMYLLIVTNKSGSNIAVNPLIKN